MRENCTSGTARGVPGNRHSYRRGHRSHKLRSREEDETFSLEIRIECDGTV